MLAGKAMCTVLMMAVAIGWTASAHAGAVRGTVQLPASLKSARRYQGYWRVDNGNVPVQPAASRGETVVVLETGKGPSPAAKTVTVDIAGLQATPAVVIVGEGSVVEFKNSDRVAHDLGTPDQESFMPIQRLEPGKLRHQKFLNPGGYLVRCLEYPQVAVSVIVVASPHYAVTDDKGSFRITDAPEGTAKLRVWSRGRWVHEQELQVGGKSPDLQIKVSGPQAASDESSEQ
jgi:plastocyanin